MQLPQIFHEVGFGVFAVVIDRPVARLVLMSGEPSPWYCKIGNTTPACWGM
jgi:hypothetical protein